MFAVGVSVSIQNDMCQHVCTKPFDHLQQSLTASKQCDLTLAIRWTQKEQTSLPHLVSMYKYCLYGSLSGKWLNDENEMVLWSKLVLFFVRSRNTWKL